MEESENKSKKTGVDKKEVIKVVWYYNKSRCEADKEKTEKKSQRKIEKSS